MLSFHKAVEADFLAVNQLVVSQLHSDVGLVENIGHYIVESGGKRLRPVVTLLSARANGYLGDRHLSMATIVEFIHTATLLHDDVVDMSSLRRGRETANAQWGNAPSVLVGDFLYSRAFQMLVAIGDMRIMQIMADATNIISEGEVQQLANAGNPDLCEVGYSDVIYKKTAKLFEAAAEAGAVLSGASPQAVHAMADYGKYLGNAFQIADDVLDYQGDVAAIGKNVGDDLAEGKMTLPLIYAREHGDARARALITEAVENRSAERFSDILQVVQSSGGIQYSLQQAAAQVDKAKAALALIPDSPYRQVMVELAEFAVSRDN